MVLYDRSGRTGFCLKRDLKGAKKIKGRIKCRRNFCRIVVVLRLNSV